MGDEWILWQLLDSAFPTGGFAHSGGLEAAWQHGEVSSRLELPGFLESALRQVGRSSLPLVLAAHREPERLAEFDRVCHAFTTNHVANRASRLQGRALLLAVQKVFPATGTTVSSAPPTEAPLFRAGGHAQFSAPFSHFAPVFGAVLKGLGLEEGTTGSAFLFNHLRGLLAGAVRLNIVGPMEAQALQFRLAPRARDVLLECSGLGLDDLAQVSPLLDLWQGAQDRLYSRLFQS